MVDRTKIAPEDFEVASQFPGPSDVDLDTKVSGIIKSLGIEQTPDETFLNDLEAELVSSVNTAARIGAKKSPPLSKVVTRNRYR